MKSLLWFLVGAVGGFAAAHAINKNPTGHELLADVDARIGEFTERIGAAYRGQEAKFDDFVSEAKDAAAEAKSSVSDAASSARDAAASAKSAAADALDSVDAPASEVRADAPGDGSDAAGDVATPVKD